jgi:histidinol dehydrogenase
LSKELLKAVERALPKELKSRCTLVYESDRQKAFRRANELAAEHVEIVLKNPQDCLDTVRNGGAFFLNGWSPAVMGDYWAGPSHVLPTGRSARFASGLSVATFLKRSSLIEVSAAAYQKGWKNAHALAQAEGLTQHARSLSSRIKEGN